MSNNSISKLVMIHSSVQKKIHAESSQVSIFVVFYFFYCFCDEIEWHHNFNLFEKREIAVQDISYALIMLEIKCLGSI